MIGLSRVLGRFGTRSAPGPGGCRACGAAPLKSAPITAATFRASAVATVGALFGILGAALLALPAMPGWGFGAFLVSNVAWLINSAWQRNWALHLQQWVFLVCSLVGLWNWWLGPLLLGGRL